MKITKVIKQGEIRWRVNDPNGPEGKRQRKFFATWEEAEHFTKDCVAETKAYGVEFGSIPPKERAGTPLLLVTNRPEQTRLVLKPTRHRNSTALPRRCNSTTVRS